VQPDIDYSTCLPAPATNYPTISSNVYDIINRVALPPGTVNGNFNTDQVGNLIGP
jgi:hypothetical protein